MGERRLTLLYVALSVALGVIAVRLFCVSVLQMTSEDPDAVLRAPAPLEMIPAYRGAILDRNGETLAADAATLDLAAHYREALLLARAGGEPLSAGEARALRRYAVARLKAARDGRNAGELLLLGEALRANDLPAAQEEELRDLLRRRLDGLAAITGRPAEELRRDLGAIVRRVRALRANRPRSAELYEETIPHLLVANVSIDVAACVEGNPDRYPGMVIQQVTRRCYPNGSVAPHVIGYLGRAQPPARGETNDDPTIRPGERIGVTGIEKQYDRLLRGLPGILNREADPVTGAPLRHLIFPAQPGATLRLTLDLAAQRQAEKALEGAKGAAVVMDVRTGELLVLASAPTFDLADIAASLRAALQDPARPLLSRATQDSVPSGSMIKPIVAVAALDTGEVSAGETMVCRQKYNVGGTPRQCNGNHGPVDMPAALSHSCNIYFWELGRRIGPRPILDHARAFGFAARTGVDVPFEYAGRLADPSRSQRWNVGDTLNLSVGQGDVSVTPLQVAVAMGALATGKALRPRLLLHADPPPEDPAALPSSDPVAHAAPMSPVAARAVREGMRAALYSGTARGLAKLRDLNAAVKTGTAETRDRTVNHTWIGGFLPFNSPRYAFAVVIHAVPGHGAEVAGPVAESVMQAVVLSAAK